MEDDQNKQKLAERQIRQKGKTMKKKNNFKTKGATNVSGKSGDTILHKTIYLNYRTGVNKPGKANWDELEDMDFRSSRGSARKVANNAEFQRRFNKSSVKRLLRVAKLSLAV